MSFVATITANQLAVALDLQGPAADAAAALLAEALAHLEEAFEHAWRPVPVVVANACVVKVARSLREGARSANAGQLATTNNTDRVAAARAHADPLESVRHILARHVVPL